MVKRRKLQRDHKQKEANKGPKELKEIIVNGQPIVAPGQGPLGLKVPFNRSSGKKSRRDPTMNSSFDQSDYIIDLGRT